MGIRIDGNADVINAADGTLTVEGISVNITGISTASGGYKVGSAYTVFSNGNVATAGIITSTKLQVNSATNTAAEFRGSGGAGFIAIKDGDDGTQAFIGVDAGVLKFQTSGSSYSDKLTITTGGDINVATAATIKANGNATFSGIVTAASFVGDGSGLTGAGPSLTGSTDNTIVTVTGANAIQGETNLKFNGSRLDIDGSAQNQLQLNSTNSDGPNVVLQRSGSNLGYFGSAAANTGGTATDLALRAANNLIFSAGGSTERLRITSDGNVGITESTPSSKLHVHSPNHYVVTSSGVAHKHIHCSSVNGNAGEYGGAISFGMGATGAAAIAARQGTSDGDVVGLSFFTHDSSTGSNDAVEKVRIHDGGSVSFNNGILLGNSLSYDSANLMDDYEEGTFTPKLRTVGSSQGEQTGSGQYTKIGNIVRLTFAFDNKNATGLQDNNYIMVSNLPFACNGLNCMSSSPMTYNVNGYADNQVYFLTSIGATALIGFRTVWNSTWQYWESGYFRGSQIYVRASITYYTDS